MRKYFLPLTEIIEYAEYSFIVGLRCINDKLPEQRGVREDVFALD